MKNREMSTQGALFSAALLVIAGIWIADAIKRTMGEPEGVITMQQTVTENPSENVSAAESTDGLVIQEAVMDFTTSETNVPDGYTTVPLDDVRIHSGLLVQVDGSYPFTGTAPELVTFAAKNESYRMKRMDLAGTEALVLAMNQLGTAYQNATGAANLMVYSTTEPYNVPGSLYPDALPDRSTGYCVDLCILNADASISKMETQHDWLAANAHTYGFVFSYQESDAAQSGVTAAPYHLRYIGAVHAGIMKQESLSLTSYYAYLRNHTLHVPLFYTYGDTTYTVYYVPSEGSITEVPVPLNASYEISGNNTDGFIVTVGASTAQ